MSAVCAYDMLACDFFRALDTPCIALYGDFTHVLDAVLFACPFDREGLLGKTKWDVPNLTVTCMRFGGTAPRVINQP